ncbi:hypothetical protein ZIOFF_000639 [Zingiber officinale]|uniref:Plastid transcriptionally active 3 n=1 Tax=Zingiber officinale TaxID=94328 RepID=A0A8J5HXL9_ZINOF|nr:hypothetical protein ZIOFF_000639 [Zingiber officinale]
MALPLPLPSTLSFPCLPAFSAPGNARAIRLHALRTTERKYRKKKKQPRDDDPNSPSYSSGLSASTAEKGLRFAFMEELMERARNRDSSGVADVIYDMVAAGLSPGPRSFHGLVVSHSLSGDEEGAMQSFRRELSAGLRPLPETFIALIRLFGSKGQATRGLEILAAMEKFKYDIRKAWLVIVEELIHNHHLEDANKVFLKGAQAGLRATDEIYDLLIEEDCKAGDHSNALTIAYEMEAAGRMATTFHFNCLLSVQSLLNFEANCGIPEIAFSTFENMEYGGEDYMKPNTETYNWVIQAYTRAESYDRVQDVAELLGMMVEDHKRLQPNVKTYALMVECFTKYCVVKEAIRHFRALKNIPGGTRVLYNEGNFGDPLSLYLRALCCEGRAVELLEALEAMAKDNQPIAPRAMIVSRKYRTLVSSWIEPLQEEADVGFEIDYIARYCPHFLLWILMLSNDLQVFQCRVSSQYHMDNELISYFEPLFTHIEFLVIYRYVAEGGLTGERKRWVPRRGKAPLDPDALGFAYSNPKETSFKQCCLEEWKIYHRKLLKTLKNEGLSILGDASEADYIRVEERLRKIIKGPNQNALKPKAASKMIVSELKEELDAQGLPIDGTRQVDEEVDELIARIKLQDGNTEYWKRRFLGESLTNVHEKDNLSDSEILDVDDDDEDWFPEDVTEALKVMRERRIFDVSDMFTIADAWGWSWERELKNKKPHKWSQEWEVGLAIKIMQKIWSFLVLAYYASLSYVLLVKRQALNLQLNVLCHHFQVIQLGGTPSIGDCAMILRAAIKAPLPSAFLTILQTTHSLGYAFGSPIYDEVILLCLDLGEVDAAIAIVTDMETTGIKVPDQTLDKVLSARQGIAEPTSEESVDSNS